MKIEIVRHQIFWWIKDNQFNCYHFCLGMLFNFCKGKLFVSYSKRSRKYCYGSYFLIFNFAMVTSFKENDWRGGDRGGHNLKEEVIRITDNIFCTWQETWIMLKSIKIHWVHYEIEAWILPSSVDTEKSGCKSFYYQVSCRVCYNQSNEIYLHIQIKC